MCGIVGYVGSKDCASLLVDGLHRLEYRGYDSAGVAVHVDSGSSRDRDGGPGIEVVRAVGKLGALESALRSHPVPGTTGIGHTRWATHGRPSEANAHPHVAGKVAVVHNGIIENHVELRRELESQGARFSSDTDTEVVAHLINRALQAAPDDLAAAVRTALRRVTGAYALAILAWDFPDRIVVARADSPLVIGLGEGEVLCASDVPALLAHAQDVVFLEDGDVATLTREGAIITTLDGTAVHRDSRRIDWSPSQAQKGGYKHFMLKEIHEQPRAIEETLRGRIHLSEADVIGENLGLDAGVARSLRRVCFVACGTSAHASMVGRYWMEQLAKVPATVEIASEVRYRDPVFDEGDLVVAVSQSGETLDTLAALKTAQEHGARVLAICNVMDSAIPRASQFTLLTRAGPEIGVASTKCFTAQLAAMLLLAVGIGRRRGTLQPAEARRILDALLRVPRQMREVLKNGDQSKSLARDIAGSTHMLFLGRGLGYPIALEGALKLKEISYIHAEGYAAGEMKHGPIALIHDDLPVMFVCPRDPTYEKTLSNLQEVKAREGRIAAVATAGDAELARLLESERAPTSVRPGGAPARTPSVLWVPAAEPEVLPFLTIVPLQLLAYNVADLRGTDIDQPRNLAKTVTVE